jgi:hypothetical protein
MIYILLYSSGLFVTSFSISFAIVAYFLHKFNNSDKNINSIYKSVYKDFQNKYPLDEIDNLEDIENIQAIEFDNYVFTEETPSGKVIMKYNNNTDFFEYYSDKHISNRILEVVCRGFVLKFKFKNIYVNYYNEFSNRNKVLEKYDEKLKEKEKLKETEEENDDVFATFKSYNMKKNEKSSTKSDILLKQQYNKFKYLGKLSEFNENNNDNDNVNNNLNYENISYEKFKTM